MRLIIRKEAEQEIGRAFAWYERQRTGLGTHFATELERGLNRIQQHPVVYSIAYRGIRKVPLHTFPYNIYYLKTDHELIVLRVLHQRRHEPTW